jgi:nitrogen fixation protein NifU and related proteins
MPRFSEKLMEHFSAPRNSGRLAAPDRIGLAGTPNHGPFMRLELRIVDGRIVEARFQTHGCGPSIACGSALTELVIGRTLAEAQQLSPENLVAALDGLPDDKRHCADTAIAALRSALKE